MTKANIYIYTHPSGDKWIYPLTSIMGIEVLNDEEN